MSARVRFPRGEEHNEKFCESHPLGNQLPLLLPTTAAAAATLQEDILVSNYKLGNQ